MTKNKESKITDIFDQKCRLDRLNDVNDSFQGSSLYYSLFEKIQGLESGYPIAFKSPKGSPIPGIGVSTHSTVTFINICGAEVILSENVFLGHFGEFISFECFDTESDIYCKR